MRPTQRSIIALSLFGATVLATTIPAVAQAPRQDAIWARRSAAAITLNGILSESAWSKAESVVVHFGQDNGIPGSGYKYEVGVIPVNPTNATLKFLVVGNQLYLGAKIRDQSIGGSSVFNRFDGLLMALKDHAAVGYPKPPSEYFYVWWNENLADPYPPGQQPFFIGRWSDGAGTPRTAEQIANWDAVTVVHGTSNTDAVNDTDWTVEMRFNLTPMGYDVTKPEGDIIEWNVSIYDCDWNWPQDNARLSGNRVWWQSPWGNAMHYDEVHIYARPDVTVNSTNPLPDLRPELFIPNGAAFAAPAIDGNLTEPVWASAHTFDIRYGDDALRATYPGVGEWRAGQFQPPVNGGLAPILDPADATVKIFWRDDNLYFGFDVRDQVVQFHPAVDRWDGFIVTINDRVERDLLDNVLKPRRLSFQVGPAGEEQPSDYLTTLIAAGKAVVEVNLKPGTTVDTLGVPDTGYTAEMRVDLTGVGYPPGLGDRAAFLGVNHLDGDSFLPASDSYGSRTWWFREYEGQCCPVWAHLATSPPTDLGPVADDAPDATRILGSFPNPGRESTIRYALARSSEVTLEVFDVSGRIVERRRLGVQQAGVASVGFDGRYLPSGMYLYRLHVADAQTGAVRAPLEGRLVVIK